MGAWRQDPRAAWAWRRGCRHSRSRARVLTSRGREAAREKELEWQEAARRLHVFLIGHAADGAFVHADDVGDLAQRERLEVIDPLLEELALPVDDEVHHLQHGLTA